MAWLLTHLMNIVGSEKKHNHWMFETIYESYLKAFAIKYLWQLSWIDIENQMVINA